MRRLTILLLCLAALNLLASQQKPLTNSRHISIADGLPCNQIFDMAQDADGFIWMATANGLCRYDGYQFHSFYNIGTSGMHAVLGYVLPDDDGRHLWMQTSTYQFACFDMESGQFVDYTGRGDDHESYRKFVKDSKGVLWMYDDESGVRRVKASAEGAFDCQDYTKELGTLPHNHVYDAIRDDQGRFWVMTQGGLTVIDQQGHSRTVSKEAGYRKAQTVGKRLLALTTQNEIHVFDLDGKLLKKAAVTEEVPVVTGSFEWHDQWMIMTQGGTFCVDPGNGQLTRTLQYEVKKGFVMQRFDGNHFVSNPSGTLWLFPREGEVRQFNFMDGVETTVDRVRRYNIAKGEDGLYYIASHGNGLYVYDLEKDLMQHYSASDTWPIIGSNYLNNILIDRSGCIWLGEDLTGINCIMPPSGLNASYYYPDTGKQGNWCNYVRMVHQNDDGSVTVSTRDNRLYQFNLQTGSLQVTKELGATVYTEKKDSQGHLWTGTRGNGLYIDGKPVKFPAQHIYNMTEDQQGRMWIATWGEGLFLTRLKDDGTLDCQQFLKNSYNESLLRRVEIGKDGRLWIATNNGIYSLDLKKVKVSDDDFQCSNMDNGRLPFDEVISLICGSDGHIWVGSRGGGLLCCKADGGLLKVEKTFTPHEGMASYNAYSIVEDRQGNIWVGTDNGISSISRNMKVSSYQFGQNTQSNIYTESCATMLNDGRLLFGTIYGMMVLIPTQAARQETTTDHKPIITSVSINGISLYLSPHDHKLTVEHDQNGLVLSFSTLDFADRSSTQYQYHMEGVDKDWLPLTSEHQAHYNGLRPGTYRFKVRALGKSNQWGEETTFTIHILQPWYNTWWAWLIWLSLISALGFYIFHTLNRNFKLHQQIKMQRELTNFRLNFFTHIVHEFRTPLAIISGAADKLTQKGNEEQVSRSAVQTVRRGTRRMSKLVNQLMEFRRINTGNLRLAVTRTDLIKLARTTFDEFRDMAGKKEQTLIFTPFAKQHEMAFDPHLVETILYNLVSNAVKYTPIGGTISLKIRQEGEQLTMIVEDNGPGISPQQVPQLYQPFMHGYVSQGGMGIGLYTAYQSAVLHKGEIRYERVSDEGGSRFTVTLPANEDVYSSSDYASTAAINTMPTDNLPLKDIKELQAEAYNDYTVAIIEDDPDMQEQISESVGQFFKTVCYGSGETALNGIQANRPDLILCDIMLPDITGYDIIKILRADEALRDIPVIMLTALDGDDHLLRGYKAGADDYMVKPCNYELLILRITQLIKWYNRVQPADDSQPVPQQVIITDEANKRFREKVETIVSRRMGEPDFNVDTLAAQLKMGRTKFYGKMKELTGMSPNNYLQTERLKRAADLLIEGDLNVTEISYKVGFQTPAYFYKCFKEKYGVAPSKFGKQQAETPSD